MATYETVKCPYCKSNLKFFEQKTSHGSFGTPIIRCHNCKEKIRTGKKLWRDLSLMEKVSFYTSTTIAALFNGLMPLIIGVVIIQCCGWDIELIYYLIPFCIALFVYLIYIQHKATQRNIVKIEEDYDSGKFEYEEY